MERFIGALAAKTPLRDGMDQATAVDMQWLASALISELLPAKRAG